MARRKRIPNVLPTIWRVPDELGGVDWQWQAADGAMGKALFEGIKSVPTPRMAAKTA